MNRTADVAIVGGGAVGLWAAHALRQRGRDVVVIDRGAIGAACSLGNAGYVSPSHVVPLAAPGVVTQGLRWLLDPESPFYVRPRFDLDLFRWLWRFVRASTSAHVRRAGPVLADLGLRSVAQYAALADRLDFGFERSGLLMLHRNADTNRTLVAHARRAGLEVEVLDADAVQALEPAAAPGLGGVFFPQDAVLDPEQMTRALHRHLASNGVRFVPHTAVTGFDVHEGRIRALETSGGAWTADEVVLAAGSWTPELGRQLGLRVPVQPAKGYSVTVTLDGGPRLPVLLTEAKVAVTPLPGGRLRFAGTLELAGLDASVDERRVRAILRAVPTYLRLDAVETDPSEAWVGFRPCTPDGLPLIGRAPTVDNLTVATGHAMLGITLAPVTGDLVAALVTGAPPPFDPTPFRLGRFG